MIRYQEAGYDDMYIQYMGEGYWDKTVSGNNTVLKHGRKMLSRRLMSFTH